MGRVYENESFQVLSFEAKAPKEILELKILKADKSSQKIIHKLEGKSTSSAFNKRTN